MWLTSQHTVVLNIVIPFVHIVILPLLILPILNMQRTKQSVCSVLEEKKSLLLFLTLRMICFIFSHARGKALGKAMSVRWSEQILGGLPLICTGICVLSRMKPIDVTP